MRKRIRFGPAYWLLLVVLGCSDPVQPDAEDEVPVGLRVEDGVPPEVAEFYQTFRPLPDAIPINVKVVLVEDTVEVGREIETIGWYENTGDESIRIWRNLSWHLTLLHEGTRLVYPASMYDGWVSAGEEFEIEPGESRYFQEGDHVSRIAAAEHGNFTVTVIDGFEITGLEGRYFARSASIPVYVR